MPEYGSGLKKQIENEITDYLTGTVNISDGVDFSQHQLVRRISLFEAKTYPTGKFDSQGNYKYWFDIKDKRVSDEVKNIDFDTKNVAVYSPRKIDALLDVITNLKLKEHLRETGQADEINTAIEEGASWGNILWKKVKGTYERSDLRNTYIINQTARTVNETAIVERHQLMQADLRAKDGTWKNVAAVIRECKTDSYKSSVEVVGKETTTPFYDIYERNGEVCLYDLKDANGEEGTEADRNVYVLARVIVAASKNSATASGVEIKYIMFADKLSGKMSDYYKEYHRGRYKGRWFREGLIELLFDLQVRANQIGNQIAQGLEFASKTIFRSSDTLIVQNVLTDLNNGDIIKAKELASVPVEMRGFTELANEWNRIIQLANEIANSSEIVQGESLPAGTPFRLGGLLNQNANKVFDFLREKLAIPFSEIFEEWIIPDLIKNLQSQDVLRLSGDSEMLERLFKLVVDAWYIENLLIIGPHDQQFADNLKAEKMDELKKRPQIFMSQLQALWKGYQPYATVDITGESLNLDAEVQTIASLIELEQDPVRRSAMIEDVARMKGYDYSALPKSTPDQLATRPIVPGMAAAKPNVSATSPAA